jgi:hypothetical protein
MLQFLSKELAICYSPLCIFNVGTVVEYFMADSVIPKLSYLGIYQLKGKESSEDPTVNGNASFRNSEYCNEM